MHINDEKFDNFAMTLMQNLNVIMVQIENIILYNKLYEKDGLSIMANILAN